MIAIINGFLSYLLVFIILVAIAIVGALVGIKLRKNKDAKEALVQETAAADVPEK
jgi:hypothetical protein